MEYFPILIALFIVNVTLFLLRNLYNNKNSNSVNTSDQDRVIISDKYSQIGIGKQRESHVAKCPKCAEWVKIEAVICKFCHQDISNFTKSILQEMKRIDLEEEQRTYEARIETARREQVRKKILEKEKQERREFITSTVQSSARATLKFITNKLVISSVIVIVLVSSVIATRSYLTTKSENEGIFQATSRYQSRAQVQDIWNDAIIECGVDEYFTNVNEIESTYQRHHLVVEHIGSSSQFVWDSKHGAAMSCFTNAILGFNISDKVAETNVSLSTPNGVTIEFVRMGTRTIFHFYWSL